VTDAGFHPAWSPDGKRLAYCMEAIVDPHSRAGTTALWIVDAGGGTPHKLFDGDAAQPVWSPSGQRIAFWGVSGGQRDIYTIAVGGGAPASVTEDAALDWSPVWSPDGKSLYFSSDRGGTMNIWRIGIDEASGKPVGKPEPVTNGVAAAAEEPSFSRDGSRLVFRARIASVNPVRLPFDLAREEIGVPEQLGHRTGILTPTSVSPDGQWLALTNLGERQEDVFIARTDGSDLRRITDDVARDRGVRWSADGKQLLFYSNRSGKYGVWSVNADGGNLRQLSAFDSDLVSLASSPDGRVIATPLSGDKAFLFDPAHSWTDQQPKTIAWSPDTMMVTDVSPDGKKLVGASYSNQGVVIVDPAGGHSVKLRGDLSIAVTKFLPDGRRLLAVTVDGRLMVIDTATGQLRVVPTPFRVDTSDFTLSPDGKTIYLGRSDTESDVWMVERRR
jgi:Tol biopolymer transport system component